MKFLKIFEHKIVFFLGLFSYRYFLDFIYVELINEFFEYEGFIIDESVYSRNVSWISLLFFFPLIYKIVRKELFSSNIVFLLFLISFIPMTCLMRFIPMEFDFFILYFTYWFLLIVFYLLIPRIKISPPSLNSKSKLMWFLIFLFSGSIIIISGYYHDFRFTLDLSDVYTFRDEESKANYPTFFNYIIPAASNIMPLFLVYFLIVKRYLWAAFLSIIMILSFSTGGHKTVLFNLFLAFFGYIFFNYKSIYKYSWGLISLLIICLIEFKTISTFLITNFLVRRALYVPSKLNYYYYDFFTKNSPDFYFQGPLRRFGLESEYKKPISEIIGSQYSESIGMMANNGLFSDAYANLNIFGIFLLPVILVIIFKVGDSVSLNLPGKLMFLPIISITASFNSGFFTSVLLTNGIILLLLSIYYYPREKNYKF